MVSNLKQGGTIMKRRGFIVGVCLAVFCLALGPAFVAAQTVKIGKPAPISGAGAQTGIPQVEGATLAVEELNAKGGVKGIKFDLIVADGKCAPLDATYSGERLVMQDKVDALLDGLCSNATMALIPIAEREKVPLVVEESSADVITEKLNPYVFRTAPNNSQIAKLLINAIALSKVKNLAFLYEQTDWGKGGAESVAKLAKQAGINVEMIAVDRSQTNFLPIISSMKMKNVDGVLIIMLIPQGVQFLKQARETNYKAQWFGFQQMMSKEMYDQAGDAADGLTGHSPFEVAGNPMSVAFAASYEKKYKRPPAHYAAHSYDGVMLIAEAVRLHGPTREGILKGLKETKDFKCLTGVINFDNHQQMILEGKPGFVVRWWKGKKEVVK
jgi:branched-chain amino acid transport system substrate-binding protein